jgi:hypothetical protein
MKTGPYKASSLWSSPSHFLTSGDLVYVTSIKRSDLLSKDHFRIEIIILKNLKIKEFVAVEEDFINV